MKTIGLLVHQDPALRVLPRGIITSLFVGLFFRIEPDLAHGLATLNADDLPGGFGPMYLAVMFLVLTLVLSANAWTRASRVSVGLPLATRTTWLIRTASLIAVAIATILSMTLVLGVSLLPTAVILNPVIALTALRAAAAAVVLILLYQLPLADRDRIPITVEYVIYVIFMTLIVAPFSAVGVTSVAGTMFFLAVAVGLGVWLFVRTPKTWSVGPSVEESASPAWSSTNPAEGEITTTSRPREEATTQLRPDRVLHRALFRGLNGFLPLWLILIATAGAVVVVTLEFFDGTNAFLPLVLVTLWHLSVFQLSLERITPFDPLPIPRSVLWAHTLGPLVVAILVGAVLGQVVYRVQPTRWSQIHSRAGTIDVPWEYLGIAGNGLAPTVTSPWGERITPKASPLWRGRPAALYDPFEVAPESSPRFIEFQKQRAFAAVYGPSFTPDNAAGASSDGRTRFAAVTLMLVSFLGTALMIPALWQYGASIHRKIFKWVVWGSLIVLGLLVVALATARLSGYIEVWYVGALVSIGIRHVAEWLPLSTSVLWVMSVTFWFGAYLLSGSIFKRIELPGRNTVNRFAEEY